MTQAGWFPDPSGAVGAERYWDGTAWSEHQRPAAAPTRGQAGLPALSKGALRNLEVLCGRCQPLVPAGETVRWAWAARKGAGSSKLVLLFFVTQLLLVFQKFYVVGVTDQQIYVFRAGWFNRGKPKSLSFTLPRDAPLTEAGGPGKLQLGRERVRVDRFWLPVVAAAQARVPLS